MIVAVTGQAPLLLVCLRVRSPQSLGDANRSGFEQYGISPRVGIVGPPDGVTGTPAFVVLVGLPSGLRQRIGQCTTVATLASTEDHGKWDAASTTLTGEITTGGCSRALATYAHTLASATYTLQKAFSVTASFPAIHKMGIFPFSGANGTLMFESVLNADATVVSGDSLTVTDTVTAS